jgi:RimJ/RimL family protein N-acetyltransferase
MLVRGRHVYLRLVRERDLDWLFDHVEPIEPRGPWYPIAIPSEPEYKTAFAKDGFWAEHSGSVLVCDVADDRILGVLFFFRSVPYLAAYEIAYRLYDLADSGRGIMGEGLALFTWLLFAAKEVNRLELRIERENIGSRRIAEKNGYRQEGTTRAAFFNRGAYHDMDVYGLLRAEAPATVEEALARVAPDLGGTGASGEASPVA